MTAEVRSGWHVAKPRPFDTEHGVFALHVARETGSGEQAWLLTRGDVRSAEPVLARVHSACVTSETFRGRDCDCAEQLDAALARISAAGRGALFYLFQEGRGAGFLAKARDRMLVQASEHRLTTFDAYARMGLAADERSYGAVVAIAGWAGIDAPLQLLTNNPQKRAALERDGVRIADASSLVHVATPYNAHYIAAKQRSGHRLGAGGGTAPQLPAVLPERVSERSPREVPEAPQLLEVARYLLPVQVGSDRDEPPLWLWLHAYLDRDRDQERVVFTLGDPRRADALACVQEQVLLERLSPPNAPAANAWQTALAGLAKIGCGVAVFLAPGEAPQDPDAATRALLAHHTGGGGPRR